MTAPTNGLDPSWFVALHLAAHRHMVFGRDVVYTYGPFGFLDRPQNYFTWTYVLATLFTAAVWLGTAAVLIRIARRSVGSIFAVLFTWVVLAGKSIVELESADLAGIAAALLLLSLMVDHDPDRPTPRWAIVLASAGAAALVLVKLNAGAMIGAVVVVWATTTGERRMRSFALAAGAMLASLLAMWLVVMGDLAALPLYLRRSVDIASGYSSAMAGEVPSMRWHYPAVVVLLVVIVVLSIRAPVPRGMRLPLCLAGSAFAFAELKHGFVRHDGHAFVVLFVLASLPFVLRSTRRNDPALLLVVAVAVATFIVALPARGRIVTESVVRSRAAVHQTLDMLSSERRTREREVARQESIASLRVPMSMRHELASHTVHVDPYETSVVWALDLRWRPVPTFQTFSAYTPALDAANAAGLRDRTRPQRVLRQIAARRRSAPTAIDGRYALFESPAYMAELLCRYSVVEASRLWTLLAAGANRCGATTTLQEVSVRAGEPVTVPGARQGGVVVASIRLQKRPLDVVLDAAFKPLHHATINLDGASYRLVTATAAGPLLLRVPPGSGWRPDTIGGQPPISVLTVSGAGDYTVVFSEIAFR